jgi:hypothetical protein
LSYQTYYMLYLNDLNKGKAHWNKLMKYLLSIPSNGIYGSLIYKNSFGKNIFILVQYNTIFII